ncbi:glycosyltransferase [Actinoplanes sp. NPDC051861]|uniref:glycosyltransferase n=1 Tax=Actinoplanes sp. NPDC051861 TaxID=3155170 RepID=UPI0034391A21
MICLLPHCAYLSQTTRMIEIYRALRERGVTPRVATYGGTYESVLAAEGIDYDLIGPRMDDERCARFLREQPSSGAVDQSAYSDEELRAYVTAEAEYFTGQGVETVVTGFALTATLSSRLAGIRLVTEHSASWIPPMFEHGLLPPLRSPRLVPQPVRKWAANALPGRARFYTGGFNRLAEQLGIPGLPSVAALILGDLTLVTEAPGVLGLTRETVEAWRPGRGYRPETRLRVTGPLFAHLPIPLPDDVERFLQQDGPVIYVAITSSGPDIVKNTIKAMKTLDARILVAGTVHDIEDDDERVLIKSVLPSHLIMPRVDLAVTAGGQGSVQTAMASGVPLLGLPLQMEQDLNVTLIERRGAGRRLSPRQAGGARMAALAGELLSDGRYRQAAEEIRKMYAEIDGPGAAAELILQG